MLWRQCVFLGDSPCFIFPEKSSKHTFWTEDQKVQVERILQRRRLPHILHISTVTLTALATTPWYWSLTFVDDMVSSWYLSFCSYRLQPLDSVFGPFKTFIRGATDDFCRAHPEQKVTIYDIPKLERAFNMGLPKREYGLLIVSNLQKWIFRQLAC